MSKNTKISLLFLFSGLVILSSCCTNFSGIPISNINERDKSLNSISTPLPSAKEVYLLWNYTNMDSITNIALSKDGSYIAGINSTDVFLLNKANNATLWNYTTNIAPIAADISATGSYIVVRDTWYVYLLNNSQETPKTKVWSLLFPALPSRGVAISEDGKHIAVAYAYSICLMNNSYQGTLAFPNTMAEWDYDFPGSADPQSVAISPDGKYIAVGCDDGCIYFFNTTYTSPKTYEWKFNTTETILNVDIGYDLTNDLYYIGSGTAEHSVYLLNSTFENPKTTTVWNSTIDHSCNIVAISSNGKNLLAIDYDRAYYFDTTYSAALKTPLWTRDPYYDFQSGDINLDGSYVVLGTYGVSSTYLINKNNETLWQNPEGAHHVRISGLGDYFLTAFDSDLSFYSYSSPEEPDGGGDDDDEDNNSNDELSQLAIPFGNYFLIFSSMVIVSLVVFMKKRTSSNSK